MNDRYLFRAKRKYNGEWMEGCLIIDESRENEYKYRIKPIENSQIHAYPVDPSTICQCTGLTDKNGQKIWEGDIFRDIFDDSIVGVVRYGEYRDAFNDNEHGGHAGFYSEWKEKQDLLRKDLVY